MGVQPLEDRNAMAKAISLNRWSQRVLYTMLSNCDNITIDPEKFDELYEILSRAHADLEMAAQLVHEMGY